jgi:hypothetical protein
MIGFKQIEFFDHKGILREAAFTITKAPRT